MAGAGEIDAIIVVDGFTDAIAPSTIDGTATGGTTAQPGAFPTQTVTPLIGAGYGDVTAIPANWPHIPTAPPLVEPAAGGTAEPAAPGTVTTAPPTVTVTGGGDIAPLPPPTIPIAPPLGDGVGGAVVAPIALDPVAIAPVAGGAVGGVAPIADPFIPVAIVAPGAGAIGGGGAAPIGPAAVPITPPAGGGAGGGSVTPLPEPTIPLQPPTGTGTGGSTVTDAPITPPSVTAPTGTGTGDATTSPVSPTIGTTAPTGGATVGDGGIGDIGGQVGIEHPTGGASGGGDASTTPIGDVTTGTPTGSATGGTSTGGSASGGFTGSISSNAPSGSSTGGSSASGGGITSGVTAPGSSAGAGGAASGGFAGEGASTSAPGGSAEAQQGDSVTQGVATNVCGDIPPTVPVQIDCSLCGIGFPQAGGRIGISFYGARCEDGSNPPPSYWLGFGSKWAQWRCPNPGEDAELDPNLWHATSYFAGASHEGCANQYRFRATLTPASEYSVNVNAYVDVLVPTTGGNTWAPYLSLSQTLTEIAGNDTTRYRGRAFASPDFVSVTPASIGGVGDPVSFAKLEIGMESMRVGCGSKDFEIPVCGMWDGTQWLTCLRAFVRSDADTSVREFAQMGFNLPACGKAGDPYCDCDRITLTGTSPLAATTAFNETAGFLADYAVLGITSGGSALETVGVTQEIQIGATTSGIQVVAKRLSNSNALWVCTNDGTGWTCSQAALQQATSPRIYSVTHGGKSYYLYTMPFPNDELLAAECSSGGAYPAPSPSDPYWCTPAGCTQSRLQPMEAFGGPYATSTLCASECSAPPDPPPQSDPWWCVDGSCVQAATQPTNSTGPYASAAACSGVCQPDETPTSPGYYCVYTNQYGSFLWSCEYYADTPTDAPFSFRYSTLSACITGCKNNEPLPPPYPPTDPYPPPDPAGTYWCVSAQDGTRHCVNAPTGAPPATLSGPYATAGACNSGCFSTNLQYWCVSSASGVGTCVQSATQPGGSLGGPYTTMSACSSVCGMINIGGFQMLPPDEPEPTPIQSAAADLIERLRTPCRHRGRRIPLPGFT